MSSNIFERLIHTKESSRPIKPADVNNFERFGGCIRKVLTTSSPHKKRTPVQLRSEKSVIGTSMQSKQLKTVDRFIDTSFLQQSPVPAQPLNNSNSQQGSVLSRIIKMNDTHHPDFDRTAPNIESKEVKEKAKKKSRRERKAEKLRRAGIIKGTDKSEKIIKTLSHTKLESLSVENTRNKILFTNKNQEERDIKLLINKPKKNASNSNITEPKNTILTTKNNLEPTKLLKIVKNTSEVNQNEIETHKISREVSKNKDNNQSEMELELGDQRYNSTSTSRERSRSDSSDRHIQCYRDCSYSLRESINKNNSPRESFHANIEMGYEQENCMPNYKDMRDRKSSEERSRSRSRSRSRKQYNRRPNRPLTSRSPSSSIDQGFLSNKNRSRRSRSRKLANRENRDRSQENSLSNSDVYSEKGSSKSRSRERIRYDNKYSRRKSQKSSEKGYDSPIKSRDGCLNESLQGNKLKKRMRRSKFNGKFRPEIEPIMKISNQNQPFLGGVTINYVNFPPFPNSLPNHFVSFPNININSTGKDQNPLLPPYWASQHSQPEFGYEQHQASLRVKGDGLVHNAAPLHGQNLDVKNWDRNQHKETLGKMHYEFSTTDEKSQIVESPKRDSFSILSDLGEKETKVSEPQAEESADNGKNNADFSITNEFVNKNKMQAFINYIVATGDIQGLKEKIKLLENRSCCKVIYADCSISCLDQLTSYTV